MKVGTDGVLLGAWAAVPSVPAMPAAPSVPASSYATGDLPDSSFDADAACRILDVGTGTGVVAMMLAQRYPTARLTAIDIDEEACRQACENVAASPFAHRIEVSCEAVQQHEGCYDAVVSNPPFFTDSLKAPDKQRTLARHTDSLPYGALMEAAWRLLGDGGELSVIVPFDYRRRMDDEAVFRGFFPCRVCAVSTVAGKPPRRYLLAFRKHPCACLHESLTIGDAYYQSLTTDFYL